MYMKTPAVCNHQRLNDNKRKKKAPRKRQRFNKHDNEEEQGLDNNETQVEGDRYVPFSSPALPLSPPQKESNCLSNLGKKTRSLTHLIYISKNC